MGFRRLAVVSLLIAVAAVGACRERASAPPRPLQRISIAYSSLPYAALPELAGVRGFYEQEGLEVTAQRYLYGKMAFEAVLQGNADMGTVGETPLAFAVLRGEPVAILATVQASDTSAGIVARKDLGVLAPADLKGRRLGITFGTIGEFFADTFLATRGISREAVHAVNLKPEEMTEALLKEEVEAVSTWSPFLNQAAVALGAKGTVFYDEDIYTTTTNLVAKQDYVARNPETVARVLRALLAAEEFLRARPDEALQAIASHRGLEPATLEELWPGNVFAVRLDQTLVVQVEEEARWAIRTGLTEKKVVPNYLEHFFVRGLASLKPDAVTIVH